MLTCRYDQGELIEQYGLEEQPGLKLWVVWLSHQSHHVPITVRAVPVLPFLENTSGAMTLHARMARMAMLFALLCISCLAAPKPIIKLGTADLSMVQTTPVLWNGTLLRFESVRGSYNGFTPRDSAMNSSAYYRFRGVASPFSIAPSFGVGHSFGSAMVQPAADGVDTMWVFGVDGNQTYISAFKSTDLQT